MPEYEVFTKEPSEAFDIGKDFARALKTGSVIASVNIVAIRISTGASVTAYIVGTATFSGTVVSVRILADANQTNIVDGDRIKITFKITTNDSPAESHEGGLICEVREI